jgi:hypothetical protein
MERTTAVGQVRLIAVAFFGTRPTAYLIVAAV